MQYDVVTITPEMAASLLQRNDHNRSIKRANVEFLKKQLKDGQWQLNGESVKISPSGRLLDGQHRLTACVESGIPFQTLVVHGVAEESQVTMDTGFVRDFANVLQLNGYKNTVNLSVTVRTCYMADTQGVAAAADGSFRKLSNSTLYEYFIARDDELIDICAKALAAYRNYRLISVSTYSLLYKLLKDKDQSAVEEFFDQVTQGIGLSKGSPILLLRKEAEKLAGSSYDSHEKRRRLANKMIRAWNKWREQGTPVNSLSEYRDLDKAKLSD